ncbi:hypothetical protein YC2023_114726 [Brassica napus]|nr:unnamed protein product [Brassica napus]
MAGSDARASSQSLKGPIDGFSCLIPFIDSPTMSNSMLAVHPGPPPKLLRNKEYEALWRAYWVDMLLLDPKAVVTATMVLERPDGKSERFYCTVSATEVVKSHPGHHLSSSPPL